MAAIHLLTDKHVQEAGNGDHAESMRKVFETDGLALNCVNRLKMAAQFGPLTRTEVEIMCTTRPETIRLMEARQ